MTDPEIPSVDRLRELADARVRAQIAAAQQRRVSAGNTRTDFAENRAAGLRERHKIRTRLAARHARTSEETDT